MTAVDEAEEAALEAWLARKDADVAAEAARNVGRSRAVARFQVERPAT